ncbi:hypothetical protein AOQ84DRAFT_419779 [Glonium stellatum]|uniref:Uncharacterized protein n=1 Tax=Glonium stellatum TaxID=574774 RepID=A0A8E2F8T1_9PEZI|nr:hypothetical protein AOQ84DRAFT_419779 [Glonium stellatum]
MGPNSFTLPVSSSSVTINLMQLSSDPPVIRITLYNSSSSSTFTILNWDSPLDPQAFNLGIYHLEDEETGDEVEIPRLMINRLLPPPREALLEIAPESDLSIDTQLDQPWMPSHRPAKYNLYAAGQWKAIWDKPARDIRESELNDFGWNSTIPREFRSPKMILDLS